MKSKSQIGKRTAGTTRVPDQKTDQTIREKGMKSRGSIPFGNSLGLLIRRDFILFWRNGQAAAVIGIGAVIVLLILFVPGDLSLGGGGPDVHQLLAMIPQESLPEIEFLGQVSGGKPANLAGIPVFIAFEVAILGFLLVAVFVFQEKQEGTLRAYRVSPGSLGTYILSKTLVFALVSLVYGTVLILAGWELNPAWVRVLGLTLLTSLIMTLLGLGFASWFSNLSGWFFPGLGVLVMNILPIITYLYPAFDPVWIQVIPSYSLLFALEEGLFFPEQTIALVNGILPSGLWLVGSLAFCWYSVRRALLQEV